MPFSSGRSTPVHGIQRSNSLVALSKSDERPRKMSSKKPYKGRYSLGVKSGKGESKKKSRSGGSDYRYDDDDYEDANDYVYHSALSSRKPSSARLFNCLPVLDSQEQDRHDSESRKTSVLSEPDYERDPEAVGAADRKRLFNEIASFVARDTMRCNVTVPKTDSHIEHQIVDVNINGKVETHRLIDYIWLVLRAYFAGKDVRGQSDNTLAYDSFICEQRKSKIDVLDRISSMRLNHRFGEEMYLTSEYLTCFMEKHSEIEKVLNDLDRFESLFSNRKAMLDYCMKDRQFNMDAIEHRLIVLYAWMNTADHLTAKIEQFGQMLGVDLNQDGAAGWPRPRHGTAPSDRERAYALVNAFVMKTMTVKGMKRVLQRVSSMSDELLRRATILLQLPADSYAQAAGTNRCVVHMSEKEVEKYGANSRGLLWDRSAQEMNLPSLLPLFLFVLGIRLQMLLEWMGIRLHETKTDANDLDLLTLETLVEDSRVCILEAVSVKRHYLETICYTCRNNRDLLPPEYDVHLVALFKSYRCYLCQFTAVSLQEQSVSPNCLFTLLETEWKAAWECAPYIDQGIRDLSESFCKILCRAVEVVVDFWEGSVFNITKNDHGLDSEHASDERDREKIRRRKLNTMVREAQERSARAFTVVRLMLSDLMTAACFVAIPDHEEVAFVLREHVLIVPESCKMVSDEWPVSLLCRPMDVGSIEQMLRTVHEGHTPEKGNYLIVLPVAYADFSKLWTFNKQHVRVDCKVAKGLAALRNDRVVVIGAMDPPLHKAHPSVFRLCSQNSAAISDLHKEMVEFSSHLDVFSSTIWDQVRTVVEHPTFVKVDNRIATHSALVPMFNFAFQFHREVGRVVWEVHELRKEFAERCVQILELWWKLVPSNDLPPTSHIPLWAKTAFNFMLHIADPIWTQHISYHYFKRLEKLMAACQQFCNNVRALEPPMSKSISYERNSSESSQRSPSNTYHDRMDKLRCAAADTDAQLELRRKECFPLGKVVPKPREDFPSPVNTPRKAPFRWQMLEKIGEGQFGIVYKALNLDQSCVIAIKQIKGKIQTKKVLAGEADILRNLSHPNLVKYYGIEVHEDEVLILMEYCAEGTLEKICREGMDMTLVRRYANHLLQAVEYIHEQKVIHRDVKPANIFLDLSCVLKLGDFGCSIRLQETATVFGEFSDFIGTPNYMAPEMCTGGISVQEGATKRFRGYGRSLDIWSVGCVVVEMVTGRRPWNDLDGPLQIVFALGSGKIPEYPTTCPSNLKQFLDACFELNSEKRKSAASLLTMPFVNIHTDPQGTIDNR